MSTKRWTGFGIILEGEIITSYQVDSADSLGLEISPTVRIPGMISEYEEHKTRKEAGYTIPEWYNLEPEERALEVALMRIDNSVDYQKYLKEKDMMSSKSKGK